ncbi:MAG: DUF3047 domain-containing protein [Gammaproteobacteria bacterium]
MSIKSQKFINTKASILLLLAVFSAPISSQQKDIIVGNFSSMDVTGWGEKSFNGDTKYQIEDQSGLSYLHASADRSASAWYKKIKIDLDKTPYLNWSWRVDQPLPELNEQTKAGDDYSARIYVIVKRGFAPWKTNALNYVWSSNEKPKESWPNAFTDKAMMIPLRSSLDDDQQWVSEKVNVKLDFERYFGVRIDEVDGVAIMVDADNSKLQAAASFGDIFFTAD